MKLENGEVSEKLVEEARAVLPVFSAVRLLALRELDGRMQRQLASDASVTPSALSQTERGLTTPTASNLARLANALGVPPAAFADRAESVAQMKPQFRHSRRTPKKTRRQAEQLVFGVASVAQVLRRRVQFPPPFASSVPINPDQAIEEIASDVERAAAVARQDLGIEPNKPTGDDFVECLEQGGVTIVRDPETSRDIDAYSAIIDEIPLIVLDGAEASVWDRDNFNLAHELGHLVMHRGVPHTPGTRSVEAQAHRFAGAFLAPADAITGELPRDLDWSRYLELKRRWGMSMASLVRRAKDLEVISDAMYTRAMKQRSTYGWRGEEPGSSDRVLPQPTFLSRAMAMAELSVEDVANAAQLPREVVSRIVGRPRPSLLGP